MKFRRMAGSSLLGLALLVWSHPGAAQGGDPKVRWTLGNPKIGFCLHFLMDSGAAAKNLMPGQRLALAREATGVPDALQRVLDEQSEYEAWVPSQLCVVYPEAIWVNSKRFDHGDGGGRLGLAIWGISVLGGEGSIYIRTLASNSGRLNRAMAAEQIPMQRVDMTVDSITESEDERFVFKLEGALITLDGHVRTDSGTVENVPFPGGAVLRGDSNARWSVVLHMSPASIGTLVVALRVQGKRGLGGALRRSPIRFVEKILTGGMGEISFSR